LGGVVFALGGEGGERGEGLRERLVIDEDVYVGLLEAVGEGRAGVGEDQILILFRRVVVAAAERVGGELAMDFEG
jgi:hypothetical protein